MGMEFILENLANPLQPMQQNVGYLVLNLDTIPVANLASARIFVTKHDILIYFTGLVLTKDT